MAPVAYLAILSGRGSKRCKFPTNERGFTCLLIIYLKFFLSYPLSEKIQEYLTQFSMAHDLTQFSMAHDSLIYRL